MKLSLQSLREAGVRRCEESFRGLNAWSPLEWAGSMAGEAGEACNLAKKLKRFDEGTNTKKDPQTKEEIISKLAAELANTVIYADLLAASVGIDLEQAIIDKFNEVSRLRNSSYYLEPIEMACGSEK